MKSPFLRILAAQGYPIIYTYLKRPSSKPQNSSIKSLIRDTDYMICVLVYMISVTVYMIRD